MDVALQRPKNIVPLPTHHYDTGYLRWRAQNASLPKNTAVEGLRLVFSFLEHERKRRRPVNNSALKPCTIVDGDPTEKSGEKKRASSANTGGS